MTQVGSVYGEALYTLALEEGLTGAIGAELTVLQQSFAQEPDFIRLLSSPNLSKQERIRILDETLRGKVHEYVLNFLKILTEKGYVKHFGHCCAAYEELYNHDNGADRKAHRQTLPDHRQADQAAQTHRPRSLRRCPPGLRRQAS